MGARGMSVELRGPHEVGGHARGGGGRAPTLVGSPELFWPNSFTPCPSSGPKVSFVKFQVDWTSFDFPFLRNPKTR